VYLEKPAGNSIGECNSMLKAQQHYQKIVQVGQWQRSQQHFADAVAFIQKGDLGNIRTVKTWCYQSWLKPGEVIPNTASPATFDYKQWIGPAPMRPYNPNHTHFHFRWFWDFAGGLMTDWGVHLLDYALIGMNAKLPKTVTALGGKFAYPSLYQETPDTLTTLYEFDKFVLTWDSAMGISNGPYYRNHGIAFVGNNGTLILTRDGWEVLEEAGNKTKTAIPFIKAAEPNGIKAHLQNFFDAIRQNKPGILKCSLQEGVHTAAVAQMGNIAYRSGKKVFWDKQKQMFTDAELNKKYFTNTYHNGYKLPI
jgi:predicted dehydrogenase